MPDIRDRIIAGSTALDTEPRPLVVTVVHGTWARGLWRRTMFRPEAPRWFEPGGRFYVELETALRVAGFDPTLCSYSWSGDNSLVARSDAGRGLAKKIHRTFVERPGVLQVLVGHSHGGTVAARAAGELGHLARGLFIVAIATPFLDVKEQPVSRAYKIGLWLLLVLSFGLPIFKFAKAGFAEWVDQSAASIYGAILVSWLCSQGVRLVLSSPHWRRLVDSTCKHFDLKCPILVLRARLDEAAIGIGLGNLAQAMSAFLRRFCTFLALAISMAFLGLGIYVGFSDRTIDAAEFLLFSALPLVAVLESWRATLVVAAISLLAAVALKAVNGSELAGCIASVSARVVAAPRGAEKVETVQLRKVGRLAHSLYENPRAAPEIASWLTSAVRHASGTAGAPKSSDRTVSR